MISKTISEDKTKYVYEFTKIQFRELRNGQMFIDKDGELFVKSAYCDIIDNYATSLSDGEYTTFRLNEEVYPVNCEITFSKILRRVDKEEI